MKLVGWVTGWLLCAFSTHGEFRVLSTFPPVYCFSVNLCRDVANVEKLLPENVSPHDYQFSRSSLEKLRKADLIVLQNSQLEDWLLKAVRRVKSNARLIDGSEGIEAAKEDPHIWLNPQYALACATNICRGLQEAIPDRRQVLASNLTIYTQRLAALDGEIAATLKPFTGTPIVVHHDFLTHFAKRYELRIVGVIQLAPDVQPSPKTLSRLRQKFREEKPKVILIEKGSRSKLVGDLSKEFGAKVVAFDVLETGPADPELYERAMRENARALAEGMK